MTLEEAAGKLLTSYLTEVPLTGTERREVITAIPPECRFILDNGNLACMTMIEAILEHKRVRSMNGKA